MTGRRLIPVGAPFCRYSGISDGFRMGRCPKPRQRDSVPLESRNIIINANTLFSSRWDS